MDGTVGKRHRTEFYVCIKMRWMLSKVLKQDMKSIRVDRSQIKHFKDVWGLLGMIRLIYHKINGTSW
jgi:hypothetical protein